MDIKIRYTCVKPKHTFSRIFTIEEIENGCVTQWMTEDGKELAYGDPYWCVHIDGTEQSTWSGVYGLSTHIIADAKYFSTKEAAKDYAVMNRPCLSVNDVVYGIDQAWVTNPVMDKLKALAIKKQEGK